MNQIAERTDRPAKASLVAGASVAAIVPQSIEECFRLSEAIAQSGMAPYGLDTPQKVMIAMMSGLELGMPPMMAVQSIAVINNRPCMWGDALIGVVRSGSVCTYVKEWIEGDGDDRIAYCETLRKGEAEPVKRQFSVDDAKRAGLWQTQARVTKTGKGGGTYEKDNDSPWYRYPQRMLQMRARAWCLRDTYPDILKGMQVREEVEDYQHVGPDNAKDITPKPSVMDRLRANADNAAQQSIGEREGFSASSVQQQTDRVLTGDIVDDETVDPDKDHPYVDIESEALSPDALESDDAASPPAASSNEPEGSVPPPSGSSGSDELSSKDRAVLIKCYAKLLAISDEPDLDVEAKEKILNGANDVWKAELPERLHKHLKSFFYSALGVIRGHDKRKAAREYAGFLECTVEELIGETDG